MSMSSRRINTIFSRLGQDGTAGAAITLAGLTGFLIVRDYPVGSLSDFGPGFMPWVATIGMMGLGSAMMVRALAAGVRIDFTIVVGRPLILVPLGMAVFALGLDFLGLALSSALAVLITSFASTESRLTERLVASVVLAALITLVFGYGLSMTVPLWPWFLRA
jgi:hypothetical protein